MKTQTKLHIPGAPFKMGDLVRAPLSGFQGIVSTHTRHLTGCDRVGVISRSKTKDDGQPQYLGFDVLELELVESNPMNIEGFPDDVPAAG